MAASHSGNVARVVNLSGQPEMGKNLIKEVTGTDAPPPVAWHVSNKYYSATITVLLDHSWDSATSKERKCEALILICSLNERSSLESVQKLWKNVGETVPICVLVGLVTDPATTKKVKDEALQWCIKQGFELVEWVMGGVGDSGGEVGDSDDSGDEGFQETVGIGRVSEALQAHMWPEMELKADRRNRSDLIPKATPPSDSSHLPNPPADSDAADLPATNGNVPTSDGSSNGHIDSTNLNTLLPEDILSRGMGDMSDAGGENFEQLFGRFSEMKAHAESLPHEERKVYAEKVVMAFWKAIGGDEDEVNMGDSDEADSS